VFFFIKAKFAKMSGDTAGKRVKVTVIFWQAYYILHYLIYANTIIDC